MVGAVLKICKNHKIDKSFYKKVREAKKNGAVLIEAANGLKGLSNMAGKQNESNQEEVKRELQSGVPDNKEVKFKNEKESKLMFPPAGDSRNFTFKSNNLNKTTEYGDKNIVHHETGNLLKSDSLSAKVIPSQAIDTNAPKISLINQSKFSDAKNEPKTVLLEKTKSSQPEGTEEVHNDDGSISEDYFEEAVNEIRLQLTGRSHSTISGEVSD